jgi:hypothetical protein
VIGMNSFLTLLFATDNPVLPHPLAMQLALHGVWSVLLGSATLWMAGRLARPWRWGAAGLVALWTLLPGAISPAFWLGLAFQTPSVMSVLLCLGWLWRSHRQAPGATLNVDSRRVLPWLAGVGVVLGWVLLLDTLAWWPLSLYAWGFSAAAVGAVALAAAVLWGISGQAVCALPLGVLACFVLTRLPTGNVWDALLDPWLWVALQGGWLLSLVRRWRMARRVPPATRA